MNRQILHYVLLAGAATVLAACASRSPPAPVSAAPAAKAAVTPTAPAAKAVVTTTPPAAKRLSGYTAKQRGDKVVYCKKEILTGSRTSATEICMTEDEMERARRGDLDLVRRLDAIGGTAKGETNASGGPVIDVMHR